MFVSQPESVVRVEANHTNGNAEKGSGVLIRSNQVLTANHVIIDADASSVIKVIFKDGTERTATVSKSTKLWDLALLTFEPVMVKPSPLAARSAANGDKLTICGFPGGGNYAEREGRVVGFRSPDKTAKPNLFVVSVKCESGMSGGPAFNERGEVVGTLFGTLKDANCTGLQAIKELLNERQLQYQLSAPVSGNPAGNRSPYTKLSGQGSNHSSHRQRSR